MTLLEMLQRAAAENPHKVGLRFNNEVFTYAQLLDLVNRLGQRLQRAGVVAGDKVVMLLPNTPAFIVSYFAVTGIGAVAVPVNPVWTTDEVGFVVDNAQAKALIAAPLSAAKAVADRVSSVFWVGGDMDDWEAFTADANRQGEAELVGAVKETDLAVFIYTSGTTGKPKGAMLTHRNLVTNAGAIAEAMGVHGGDNFLCVLPLFHCLAATVCMLAPISLGAEIVLMEQFVPREVLKVIEQQKVSVLVGVPAMFVVITASKAPPAVLQSVRVCLSGGAPLPVSVLQRFSDTYGVPIREGYGLSEASPVVSVNRPENIKPGTVGTPVPGVKVRVVDTSGKDLPTGKPGELLVQGDNVMAGYFGLPEATAAALQDGWLHTGDIASVDAEGAVTIIDRLKDMINVGGLKVYPREVEEVLYTHPKVKEAAVVGVTHPLRGESVKAVISVHDGEELSAQEVAAYCRDKLANYKLPKTVEFRAELPKSSTGKILRRMLQ